MLYDLRNALSAKQARAHLELLIKRGCVAEVTEKRRRSLKQNNYLHLLLGYFASQTGNTLEWVKRMYYKVECNKDLFVREWDDPYLGRVKRLRSSTELSPGDMTTSIERFRKWSEEEAGIYLPKPNERDMLRQVEIEVENSKPWTGAGIWE